VGIDLLELTVPVLADCVGTMDGGVIEQVRPFDLGIEHRQHRVDVPPIERLVGQP